MADRLPMHFAYGLGSIGEKHGGPSPHAFCLWTRVHRRNAWWTVSPCILHAFCLCTRVHRRNTWRTVSHAYAFCLWTRSIGETHGGPSPHAFCLWTRVHSRKAWRTVSPCILPMDSGP